LNGIKTPSGKALQASRQAPSAISTVRAYADLLRIHFFFAWPLLFCSGFSLAVIRYGGFSWDLAVRALFIAFCGFEAGLVLNDWVDREHDRLDVERSGLTRYWRPFGTRPIPSGSIPENAVLVVFILLAGAAIALALTLPFPHSIFVVAIAVYSYSVEAFYQRAKRSQSFPLAQLVGRTDLALFPAAGYLVAGFPDWTALLLVIFLYPFAQAHLGVNDLADLKNDLARGMKTVTVLYSARATSFWIAGFTIVHLAVSTYFLPRLGPAALAGWLGGGVLLVAANFIVLRRPDPESGLKALPLFHGTMVLYSIAIIVNAAFFMG